jgi:glycine betaine/proline transport system substrate-binding protein
MKASRKLSALILMLVTSALVAGCSSAQEAVTGKQLTLGNIGWDENTVVANMTKVLLEEDLGYDNVKIQQADVGPTFQGVGSGDIDAFQDVWMPNHQDYMSRVQDRVERLSNWYTDTTQFGLAAPTYMGITSIDQINSTGAEEITGIEPGAVISEYIDNYTIPEYGLNVTQRTSSTAAMLSELQRKYSNGDPIIFPAWKPHRMNDDYDFVYLDDPKDTLYPLNRPSEVSSIVSQGLRDAHPDAYTLMDSIRLSEDQVVSIERDIEGGTSPEEAVRNWIENNRDTVQPWIDAAKAEQE